MPHAHRDASRTALLTVLLCLCGWPVLQAAEDARSRLQVLMNPEMRTATVVRGDYPTPIGVAPAAAARQFVGDHPHLFGLRDPENELELIADRYDVLGKRHLRFQQRYLGLRVWGRQTIVHFDTDSSIYMVAGQTVPTPDASPRPTVAEIQATDRARSHVQPWISPVDLAADLELLFFPEPEGSRLAWLVTLTHPYDIAIRWRVFVDAHTSEVLFAYHDVPTDGPARGWGVDVLGVTQPLETYETGGVYRLIDATLPGYRPPVDSLSGVIVTYDYWRNGGPITSDPNGDNIFDDTPALRPAVSAHRFARLSHDYFHDLFGRDGYDDSGSTLIVSVHDSLYTNNAFWADDGSMNFSDGDGVSYLPFSGSLDIVAHEFAHGVTEYSAGLIYAFQPGALNEHYSDFFGAMIDRDDWLLGEDIRLSDPGFIRSMSDPASTGQPAHMSEYQDLPPWQDNGGVHTNSGIGNRVAFLVATWLDRERTEQIWYRTLTEYLTPDAHYPFWALVTLQATADLYGDPSSELSAVAAALDSVGLGGIYAWPDSIRTLSVTLGETADTAITVFNLGVDSVTVDSVTASRSELSVSGPFPAALDLLDTVRLALHVDASGLISDCDVGVWPETLTVYTSSPWLPVIEVPIALHVTYVPAAPDTAAFATGCIELITPNTPGLEGFVRDSTDVLFDGSLLLGLIDGSDTTIYWDLYEPGNFPVVDTFVAATAVPGFHHRTLRFVTYDQKLNGTIDYRWPDSMQPDCDYLTVAYTIRNSCDTPLTVLAGLFADFNIPSFALNWTVVNTGRALIAMRDDQDTRACGIAQIGGMPRNLRSINNPLLVWDGFTETEAYTELASVNHSYAGKPDDWSALLTFEEVTLAAGDSAAWDVALIYSATGTAGVVATAHGLGTGACPIVLTGDVNYSGMVSSADIIALVHFVFKGGPSPLPCEAAGDVNCTGSLSSADIIYLVNFVFKGGPEPCDACTLVPGTWTCP